MEIAPDADPAAAFDEGTRLDVAGRIDLETGQVTGDAKIVAALRTEIERDTPRTEPPYPEMSDQGRPAFDPYVDPKHK